MKILVTGFDPFGGEKINPAIEAVKKLPDEIDGNQIIKLEVPTIFYQSAKVVKEAITKYQPDMVINVGQAGGRAAITPERIAINFQAGSTPDNSGKGPKEGKIEADGADGYFTQLPIKKIVTAMRKNRHPCRSLKFRWHVRLQPPFSTRCNTCAHANFLT